MHQSFSAKTVAGPGDLFDIVADLGTYPEWLDVVSQAVPSPPDPATGADEPPAWVVTLRAQVGPFARSKRLRMARVVHDRADGAGISTVRFERRELDGKNHSDWILSAEVSPAVPPAEGDAAPMRSQVTLDLSYQGGLWTGLLDGVLAAAAERATGKLQAYVRP